uniref:U-box domain-containing protein n=1 Tax=Anthurium amnicola TaxID=1678845 RepID=A0A1D1ZAL8_9ARAE
MEVDPEIPPFFLCPISLQIMTDPVTVSTGVTYNRDSIQRWLSAYRRHTCPVTNQPLPDLSLTPNTTLLRLIQSWAADNPSLQYPAMPPEGAVDALEVLDLVGELRKPETQMKAMRRIKALVQENGDYRACMEEAVTSLLSQMIKKPEEEMASSTLVDDFVTTAASTEATILLHLISPSPGNLKQISECRNGELISSLSSVLQRGSYQARVHAALLLKSIFEVVDDCYKADLQADLFDGVVEVLKDQNSDRPSTMAALSILMEVVPVGRNRARAVESGTVAVLVELLVEEGGDRRKCEAMLALLELLCARAEGRSALAGHPAGVAAVAGKVLSVSHFATDRAVRVLLLVCRSCGGSGVVEEMMAVGAVAKLCMVVQAGGSRRTREKAKEIFGMHLKSWSKFPCFPSNCIP